MPSCSLKLSGGSLHPRTPRWQHSAPWLGLTNSGGEMMAFYFSSPEQQVSVCEGRASLLFLRALSAGRSTRGRLPVPPRQAGRRALPEQSPFGDVNRNLPWYFRVPP